MSYQEALEAAGAEVIAFESFGDYQGSWYAKVKWNDEIGWVEGSYGSCSGCDAFEAEFGYGWIVEGGDGWEDYQQRLKEFGESYLSTIYSQDQQESLLQREIDNEGYFAEECEVILDFVKSYRDVDSEQ